MPDSGQSNGALVGLDGVARKYRVRSGFFGPTALLRAVDGISLNISRGETLGLVGESGCGKSTLARLVLGLERPTEGRVLFEGADVSALGRRGMRRLRRRMQIIFQDPFSSLNPRQSVGSILGEPLKIHRVEKRSQRRALVAELMDEVGLRPEHAGRYPHEFSGGQRQRICIARALALRPELVVADEPVSALDVSIQAQVLNLLSDLQEKFQLTYLFIAHDLAVVRHVSDRVAVMYLGRLVEMMNQSDFDRPPAHPYTEALLASAPVPKVGAKKGSTPLAGDLPSPINPPSGCRFHPRCPEAKGVCAEQDPPLVEKSPGRFIACHFR
jgi:peptide/nickel transport system ATP-binding protein/oligopeptide transport system ATP-binding protein